MPRQVAAPGTASALALQILTQYPDREMRLTDLVQLAEGKHQPNSLAQGVEALAKAGLAVKTKDGKSGWYAVARGPAPMWRAWG